MKREIEPHATLLSVVVVCAAVVAEETTSH